MNGTIIDASGVGNVVYISSDLVNVSGLTIQNGGRDFVYGGIFLNTNSDN